MTLKSLFQYKMPQDIISSDFLVFIHIREKNQGIYIIQKTYIAKKDYYSFVEEKPAKEEKNIKTPRCRTVEHGVQIKELEQLAKLLSLDFEINTLNKYLSRVAVTRIKDKYSSIQCGELSNIVTCYNKLFENETTTTGAFKFEKTFGNNLKIRLFNVGQANCSFLLDNGVPSAIFDLGCMRPNNSLTNAIENIDNVDIIISHFDNDHINIGKKLFKKKRNNIRLFYPLISNFDSLSINAQLFVIGAFLNNYHIYSVSLTSGYIQLGIINIYQGHVTKDKYQSTDINAKCLISYIKSSSKTILIPGDALYTNFPILFTPTHLIIPHHGCEHYAREEMPFLLSVDEGNVMESFVFCGPSRRYRHPNLTHLDRFHTKDEQIIRRFFAHPSSGGNNKVFKGKEWVPKNEDYTICSNRNFFDWELYKKS